MPRFLPPSHRHTCIDMRLPPALQYCSSSTVTIRIEICDLKRTLNLATMQMQYPWEAPAWDTPIQTWHGQQASRFLDGIRQNLYPGNQGVKQKSSRKSCTGHKLACITSHRPMQARSRFDSGPSKVRFRPDQGSIKDCRI